MGVVGRGRERESSRRIALLAEGVCEGEGRRKTEEKSAGERGSEEGAADMVKECGKGRGGGERRLLSLVREKAYEAERLSSDCGKGRTQAARPLCQRCDHAAEEGREREKKKEGG